MDTASRLADLQRTFVAPPGLAYPGPRPVRLTVAGRVFVGLIVLLFVGAIVAGLALYWEARRQAANRQAIVDHGAIVGGEVIRLWPTGEHRRRVRYRFVADGIVRENQTDVSSGRRRLLSVGATIPVRYLPENPDVNDLGGVTRSGMPMWVPPVVGGALAACGVLCLLGLNRQRRLLMDGRAAPAVVTGMRKHSSPHGGTHRTITFEFPLLSGATRAGKRDMARKPPEIGSVMCVIYDPDQPSRHTLYPLSLVRPA